jgi:hypothetical protein
MHSRIARSRKRWRTEGSAPRALFDVTNPMKVSGAVTPRYRATGTQTQTTVKLQLRTDFSRASITLGNQRADPTFGMGKSRGTRFRATTEGMSTGSGPNTCLQVPDSRRVQRFRSLSKRLVPTACSAVLQVSDVLRHIVGILGRLSVELVHPPWTSAQRSLSSTLPIREHRLLGTMTRSDEMRSEGP